MILRCWAMLGMVSVLAACSTTGGLPAGSASGTTPAETPPVTTTAPAAAAPSEVPESTEPAISGAPAQVEVPAAAPTPEEREAAARRTRATSQYEAALTAMRAGNTSEASARFRQMTLDFPELSGPYTNLGILHYRAGEFDTAQAEFIKALSLNPQNATSLNYLGIISREQGRFEEAYTFYQEALAVAPDYANAHLNLGILLDLYLGRLDEALVHYKQYQALTEDVDESVRNWIVDLGRRVENP